MDKSLPVGSAFKPKSTKSLFIVVGKNIEHEGKKYDYICVPYPYGFLVDKNMLAYFNEKDIEYIHHIGNINYK